MGTKKPNQKKGFNKGWENLRPAKKGEVRNPLGGRAHNPALRALKRFTNETFREILELVLTGNMRDLEALIKNPESNNLQVIVGKAFKKAVDHGEFGMVERIAERLLGRVPETVHIKRSVDIKEALKSTDKEEIKKILEEIEDDV